MREYIVIGVQIPRRTLLKLLLFYYAIYTWYYSFLATLNALQIQYPMQPPLLLVFFSTTIAATLLVSGLVSQRRVPVSFIYAWAVLSPLLYLGYTVSTDPVVVTALTIIANVTMLFIQGQIHSVVDVGGVLIGFLLGIVPVIGIAYFLNRHWKRKEGIENEK